MLKKSRNETLSHLFDMLISMHWLKVLSAIGLIGARPYPVC